MSHSSLHSAPAGCGARRAGSDLNRALRIAELRDGLLEGRAAKVPVRVRRGEYTETFALNHVILNGRSDAGYFLVHVVLANG